MIKMRFLIFVLLVIVLVSQFFLDCRLATAEGNGVYTLEELMSIALKTNPSIAVFKANLEASKGDVLSASAYPNPEIELEGGNGSSLETNDSKGEYSTGIGQPLERPAKRSYRKKAALANVAVAERDLDDFYLHLKSEVRKVFFRLLSDKKVFDIAKENLKIVNELFNTVELKVKAGEVPEYELVKAKTEVLRADKELKRAFNAIAISKASLNAMLGNSLKDEFDIEGEFKLPDRRYELPALLSNAMGKHPLIVKAKKELEAKGYSLEMEKASLFPDITVKGFFSRELDKEAYGLGIALPIPIWYQRTGEIATARGEVLRAEAGVVETTVQLSRGITESYQNYLIALDQINIFEEGLLKQAKEALRIAEFSYRQGESGLLDYLDAQRVYRTTFIEYYQSFFELESSLATLERVAGGLP